MSPEHAAVPSLFGRPGPTTALSVTVDRNTAVTCEISPRLRFEGVRPPLADGEDGHRRIPVAGGRRGAARAPWGRDLDRRCRVVIVLALDKGTGPTRGTNCAGTGLQRASNVVIDATSVCRSVAGRFWQFPGWPCLKGDVWRLLRCGRSRPVTPIGIAAPGEVWLFGRRAFSLHVLVGPGARHRRSAGEPVWVGCPDGRGSWMSGSTFGDGQSRD
jgi:hypothetical protein